jgi:S1-C subfamily serine protease
VSRLAVAALLALGLIAGGCGDDDPARPAAPQTSTGAAASPEAPEETATPTAREKVVESQSDPGAFDARDIFVRESPGVVTITSLFGSGSGLSAIVGGQGGGGVGSGFVVDKDGTIVTNAHVVTQGEGRAIKKATEVFVQFADGNQVEAKIRGFDPFSDIAVVTVDPSGLELQPLELGTNESIEIGEPVVAIGSPFGQEQSLSVGVVSAKDRSIKSLTNFSISGAVQTDAAINPGNSGGPLVDGDAKVIGVNQQIQTNSGGNEGVGFAVPIDIVKRSVADLEETGSVRYAYLGVSTQELYPQLVKKFDLPVSEGAWVQTVSADGPAADAGLKGGGRAERFQISQVRRGGDIIVKVDEDPVTDPESLGTVINSHRPGDKVVLEVRRGSETRKLTVTLGQRPVQAPNATP